MYHFKKWEELAWFVFVAVATMLLQQLLTFDPGQVEDWREWAIALGAASVRAAAAAVLAFIGKQHLAGTDKP